MQEAEKIIAAPDLERRFSGVRRLYGASAARRIHDAHVLVVGLGGVGSWAAEALARSGVGRLTLIDLDHVSESNINRQIQAEDASLGQAKVLAMRDRIARFSPQAHVHCVEEFVDASNWEALVQGPYDAVIDACDQLAAKLVMAQWARASKVLFVTVGAAGGKRSAHKVDVDDLSRVTHDPLLAQLRYRLRREFSAPKEGRAMGVSCVFSREPLARADPSAGVQEDESLNCHGWGSTVAVTATFGQCAAGWILERLSERIV